MLTDIIQNVRLASFYRSSSDVGDYVVEPAESRHPGLAIRSISYGDDVMGILESHWSLLQIDVGASPHSGRTTGIFVRQCKGG